MPELDRARLNAKLDSIPEADREGYLSALKEKGYTWKSSAAQYKPFDPSSQGNLVSADQIHEASPAQKIDLAFPAASPPEQGPTGIGGMIGKVADDLRDAKSGMLGTISTEAPFAVAEMGNTMNPPLPTSMEMGGVHVPLTPSEMTNHPGYAATEKLFSNYPISSGIMERFHAIRRSSMAEMKNNILQAFGPKVERGVAGELAGDTMREKLAATAAERESGLNEARKSVFEGQSQTLRPDEVGQEVQKSMESARDAKHAEASEKFKSVFADIPDELKVFPADKTRSLAQEILGTKGAKPSTLKPAIESELKGILDAPQGMSWEKMHDMQSDYGKYAGRDADPVAQMIYGRLKSAVREDMKKAAELKGGDFLERYEFARSMWKDYRTNYDNDVVKKFLDKQPSFVYDTLIKNGSVEDIRAIKRVAGENGFKPLRRKFIEDIVGLDGETVPSSLEILKKMEKYKYKLGEVLGPAEAGQVKDFIKTGQLPKFMQDGLEKTLLKISEKSPSAISEIVLSGTDPTVTGAIKNMVGPKGWEPYRRAVVERIIGEEGPDLLTSGGMTKALKKMDPEYRRLFFSDNEVSQIEKLRDIKAKTEVGDKLFGNPSGTARNVIAYEAGKMLLTNPKEGLAMAIPLPILAKLYTSPFARNLIVNGMRLSPRGAGVVKAGIAATQLSNLVLQAKREYHDEQKRRMGLPADFKGKYNFVTEAKK